VSSSPRTSTACDRHRDRWFDQPTRGTRFVGQDLGALVELIGNFDEEAPSLELGDVGTAQAAASELDIRIEELGLTERSRNCLKRAGINTIAQLVNATERDLTSITNFGATSLKTSTTVSKSAVFHCG